MATRALVREIFLHPDRDPTAAGIQVEDLVFFPRLSGADPSTGQFAPTLGEQLVQLFQNMRSALDGAGLGPENVGHVSFFMPDLAERKRFNEPWVELFPDPTDRPPYKYLPAPLAKPCLIQMEMYAVVGGRRTVIEVPGVVHVDPIPMGIRIGRYLFSSRLMGTDPASGRSAPDLETHTALCVQHLQTLVQGAGASLNDLTQAIAFVKQPEDGRFLSAAWQKLFPNETERPMLRFLTTDLPGLVIRVEVMGVVDRARA